MRKGFTIPLIIGIVVLVSIVVSGWTYFNFSKKGANKPQANNVASQLPTSPVQKNSQPLYPNSASTPIDISRAIDINKITWRKIESKRVSLSFNFPSVWPIAIESDEDLKMDQDFYNKTLSAVPDQPYPLEWIGFTNEFIRNAGEDSLGWFIVQRQRGIETIDDYVKSVDKESELYVKGRNVTIPRPKIIYSKVGGETAVSVIDQSGLASLDSVDSTNDFIVVKNGLIYHLFYTPSFKARINNGVNALLFKDIITSVHF